MASSLGFASNRSHAAPELESAPTRRVPGHFQDDSDDDDEHNDDDGSYSDQDEDDDRRSNTHVDLDVLPTLLVYRDGDLVHNWVRVDWEAGRAGIEELLSQSVPTHSLLAQDISLNLSVLRCRHHILPEIGFAREDEDLSDDDLDDDVDEDLPWSD